MRAPTADQAKGLAIAAAAVAVGVVAWKAWRGIAAGAIDPTSSNNLAHRGVNAIGATVTDNPNFSLGASVFEWLNPATVTAESTAVHGTSPARSTTPAATVYDHAGQIRGPSTTGRPDPWAGTPWEGATNTTPDGTIYGPQGL
ncbi:hypothetical protein [Sphaerotilus mobilis]|uniref:Uncharacterized protein n=1 Tax=Sphaerotilus mobilis TaxID=47994 RepID=A0A4Q7LR22_9BURK|nr:hypothetical protein [Sphaerotilus mobilis]RZS56723.1 hypothetical protein EV685_1277 [Sphaerotilus mobilis]